MIIVSSSMEALLVSTSQLSMLAKCSAHLSSLADSVLMGVSSKADRVDETSLENWFLSSLSSLVKELP